MLTVSMNMYILLTCNIHGKCKSKSKNLTFKTSLGFIV